MNTSKFGSPQILSGTVSLEPGKTQTVSLNEMASRSRRWLRLDQMNVSLYADSMKFQQNLPNPFGSYTSIRSRSSRYDLMRDYMPTWLLGPKAHLESEVAFQGFNDGVLDLFIATNGFSVGAFENYRIRFPKPFYLPAGDAFVTQMSLDSDISTYITTNVTAEISVQAVMLSKDEQNKVEKMVAEEGNPIPYLSHFSPFQAAFAAGSSAAAFAKSSNLELANPFLSTLFLQRINGREKGNVFGSLNGGADSLSTTRNNTKVKIADARRVVCDLTDFRNMFNTSTSSWLFQSQLDGKKSDQASEDYLTAELYSSNVSSYCPEVAMVGYRLEKM